MGLESVLGDLVRVEQSVLQVLVDLVSSLLGLLVLSLLLESGGLVLVFLFLLGLDESLSLFLIGVQSLHDGLVLQRVLLVLVMDDLVLSDGSELGLNQVGVDHSGQVSASHGGSVESVSLLLLGRNSLGSEDLIDLLESILGPDDKSSELTSRGELEEVESGDVASLEARQVSGCLLHLQVLVSVHNQRTLLQNISAISCLSLSRSDFLELSDLSEIVEETQLVKVVSEVLGGFNVEGVDDVGDLRDVRDSVSS